MQGLDKRSDAEDKEKIARVAVHLEQGITRLEHPHNVIQTNVFPFEGSQKGSLTKSVAHCGCPGV